MFDTENCFTMKSKQIKTNFRFLPAYFKKIGLLVIVLTIVMLIVIRLMHISLTQSQKELLRITGSRLCLSGLFLFALSRNKTEDEMTISFRVQAMVFAFIFGVISVIISPFINLLFKSPVENITAVGVISEMLIFYLIIFYLRRFFNQEKNDANTTGETQHT